MMTLNVDVSQKKQSMTNANVELVAITMRPCHSMVVCVGVDIPLLARVYKSD